MKRVPIMLPEELEEALEAYRRSQDLALPLTVLTQAALREYLKKRDYLPPSSGRSFGITPARCGSGTKDISSEHDRYLAEAAADPTDDHHVARRLVCKRRRCVRR